MRAIQIWTDGANGGRNGTPGGWCAILDDGEVKLAISGSEPSTSNNRMELVGIIRGLEALGEKRAVVVIHTDSAYARNPCTRGWLAKWQREGWKTYEGKMVANRDLWEQLIVLTAKHLVRWKKVKGHTKIYSLNTVADQMAVAAKHAQAGVVVIL